VLRQREGDAAGEIRYVDWALYCQEVLDAAAEDCGWDVESVFEFRFGQLGRAEFGNAEGYAGGVGLVL